jgi:hypothetical protein
MPSSRLHEIEVTIVAMTELALLVDYEGDEQWLPISAIYGDEDDYGRGVELTLRVPEWLMKDRGWL